MYPAQRLKNSMMNKFYRGKKAYGKNTMYAEPRVVQGLSITIESPAGEFRHGHDWIQMMQHDYGYIWDTMMWSEGDSQVDCFVGPNPDSEDIFIVEQIKEDGTFDEYKVMLAFSNMAEAKDAYFANYPEGWTGFGNMYVIYASEFWRWAENHQVKGR